jgi:hemerythrin-like domain-containing protein
MTSRSRNPSPTSSGHLREHQYGEVVAHLGDALQGSGDAFIDTLARHLLYEEEVLFPEIRRLHPSTTDEIRGLQAEHELLREWATGMACAIKSGECRGAYDLARLFLAELFCHIEHESQVTDQGPK